MRPRAMQEFDLLGPLANVARRSHALHLVAVRLYIVHTCILVFVFLCVLLHWFTVVYTCNIFLQRDVPIAALSVSARNMDLPPTLVQVAPRPRSLGV